MLAVVETGLLKNGLGNERCWRGPGNCIMIVLAEIQGGRVLEIGVGRAGGCWPGKGSPLLWTIMHCNSVLRTSEHPERADNAVSKINTDYETGLCAAMASSIIQFNF
jgi:hypothetical protein